MRRSLSKFRRRRASSRSSSFFSHWTPHAETPVNRYLAMPPPHSRALPVRLPEHRVRQPRPEAFVVAELLEQLRLVSHHRQHDPSEGLVELDPRVDRVVVALGVLVGGVLGDPCRDLFRDAPADAVGVVPLDVAELVVEGLQYE